MPKLIAVSIAGLLFTEVQSALSDRVEENTIGENIHQDVNEGARTIFPLLIVIVIVAVIVAIMRLFGGI